MQPNTSTNIPAHHVDASIFRAYDIRGKVETQLTLSTIELIGRAIGSKLLDSGEKAIAIGRDGRHSGTDILQALTTGLNKTGISVINLGQATTPMVYFAGIKLPSTNSCIAITGSHNPPEYNGLKIVVQGKTLFADDIQALLHAILKDQFKEDISLTPKNIDVDIFQAYHQDIQEKIHLSKPLKLVVDAGNGVAGASAPEVFSALGCEVIPLYCEVDGLFPNHHPDPAKPENLQDLIAQVKQTGADLGLAFDGDGDRVGIVDELGNTTFADQQMMLFAEDILTNHPGAEVVYDVKCSTTLHRWIEKHGGIATMYRTGHSFIKNKLKQTPNALLAGEMSGHIFFKEGWYGFDDGTYSAARLLEIICKKNQKVSEIFGDLPKSFATPEIEIHFAEGEHFLFIDRLKENVDSIMNEDAELFTIDGIRINFANSWGLIRPSNTTPTLVLRFDGDTPEALERVKEKFRGLILQTDPSIALPF